MYCNDLTPLRMVSIDKCEKFRGLTLLISLTSFNFVQFSPVCVAQLGGRWAPDPTDTYLRDRFELIGLGFELLRRSLYASGLGWTAVGGSAAPQASSRQGADRPTRANTSMLNIRQKALLATGNFLIGRQSSYLVGISSRCGSDLTISFHSKPLRQVYTEMTQF